MLNNLFTASINAANAGTRSLPGTAELTSIASSIASNIIKVMDADAETYTGRIQQSTRDNVELDKLITELMPELEGQADFLKELDDETIDAILKSQQSKRSRLRSKAMTLDNYMGLLTAAIAEKILRDVTGRAKSSVGGGHRAAIVDYTGEQLEAFTEDQEALKREIRNIQSKKSIMKSKADFDETSERWLALLKAEQQLKDLRVSVGPTRTITVDKTRTEVASMFADVDVHKLSAKEAKELLESIQSKVIVDEEN